MADTPALITINDAISRHILKFKTTEDAGSYEHACECLKSWNLYHGNEVNVRRYQ